MITATLKKIDWKAWNRTKGSLLYGSRTRKMIPVTRPTRYANAPATLEVIPVFAAPIAGGGGGGGATGLPTTETGDPQTLQKDALSATVEPHLAHAAIIPPYRLECIREDQQTATISLVSQTSALGQKKGLSKPVKTSTRSFLRSPNCGDHFACSALFCSLSGSLSSRGDLAKKQGGP
jgi:hypothetical protein